MELSDLAVSSVGSAVVYVVATYALPLLGDQWTRELLREALWLLPVAVGFFTSKAAAGVVLAACVAFVAYMSFKLAWLRSSSPTLPSPLPVECTTPEAVERWLGDREREAGPLQPVATSRIVWCGERGARSDLVVVFIHGWSASVEELDPVDARVAAELGATLLRYRLTAHGLKPMERGGPAMLEQATRDALMCDMACAFACAKVLGRRVVLFGSSTGGTLSVWLASQPWAAPDVAAIVLVSPAFALRKPNGTVYLVLKWIIACCPMFVSAAIINTAVGRHHFVQAPPACPDEEAYSLAWTRRYPCAAILHLVQIYMTVEASVSMASVRAPVLAFACPDDPVCDFRVTQRNLGVMPHATLDVVRDSQAKHVISGRHCSPATVDRFVDTAVAFLSRELLSSGGCAASGDAPAATGARSRQRRAESPRTAT